ncbi:hypothetical protein BDQ17DRAFT_1329489 [Cyathus striatus]|nr:hypothetical protein BDQ17DRAFT_1329489 [Cyathus striatus]
MSPAYTNTVVMAMPELYMLLQLEHPQTVHKEVLTSNGGIKSFPTLPHLLPPCLEAFGSWKTNTQDADHTKWLQSSGNGQAVNYVNCLVRSRLPMHHSRLGEMVDEKADILGIKGRIFCACEDAMDDARTNVVWLGNVEDYMDVNCSLTFLATAAVVPPAIPTSTPGIFTATVPAPLPAPAPFPISSFNYVLSPLQPKSRTSPKPNLKKGIVFGSVKDSMHAPWRTEKIKNKLDSATII